jgi:transposase
MSNQPQDESSRRPTPQGALLELPELLATDEPMAAGPGKPRLRTANRRQVEWQPFALDELLPAEHQARVVWDYVQDLDLAPLLDRIAAVEGRPGHPPIDPRILLALWLYATLRGVGSARELDRLCEKHVDYRWLCGGVSVNYHTLSDFRTQQGNLLEGLLIHSVAVLRHEGLVTMDRVAQDGMRVRASAGAASFRRRPTLEKLLTEAEEQVAVLRAELEADPTAANRRQQAARQRAAEERQERLKKALAHLPEAEAKKKPQERDQARVSTTDPEARVMKMAGGGFRPAYNAQLATDTATQVIVGVDLINSGTDQGQMAPMVEQLQACHGSAPDEMLVDGGFATKEDIEQVSRPEVGVLVYAPVMKPKDPHRDPHVPREDDSPVMAEWRVRMGTASAKEIYKQRAATAECVNAIARNRGFQQVRVRGLLKVRAVLLWYALAHNVLRTAALRAAAVVRAEVCPAVG